GGGAGGARWGGSGGARLPRHDAHRRRRSGHVDGDLPGQPRRAHRERRGVSRGADRSRAGHRRGRRPGAAGRAGPDQGDAGAALLMARKHPVITIDGPAGAGKSTAARLLAERLGYTLVPTRALYPALAPSVMGAGVPVRESAELRAHLAPLSVTVAAGRVYLDGEDVTEAIRSRKVAQVTSDVTTLPSVRAKVTPLQRQLAAEGGVVLEGRDTGTVVCPDAEVKFYLTASLDARARRRQAEAVATGTSVSRPAITSELATRDRQDETRELAPLRRPPGAIEIDTSDLTLDQVVERLIAAIEHHKEGNGGPAAWNRLYATMKY